MSAITRHRLWIGGAWRESAWPREIRAPHTGEVIALGDELTQAQMEAALAAAKDAFPRFKAVSRYTRSRLLSAMAEEIGRRRQELVGSIVDEVGKPVALADGEVSRAVTTFTVAAEEAKRYGGELFPVDVDAPGRAYDPGISIACPRGPVLAITPFNFPLNLVAHKVAPALAVGAPVLVKPAPQAPGATRILAEIFAKAAGLVSDARDVVPLEALQTVSAQNEVAALAVRDPRITTLSFTGSASVGWNLQMMARGKKVILELGGNGALIVHKDADLERAVARAVFGAFAYAGQVCISVQNIFVEETIYEQFKAMLLDATKKVQWGDPRAAGSLGGPLIDERSTQRVLAWIDEAKGLGARVLAGGTREGKAVLPTVLEDVPVTASIACEEVFGPVAVLASYAKIEDAIVAVNRSRYGLQAGVFTDSRRVIGAVIEGLDVGGILINEVPTYRADHMPYGGVKESGLGREGVRYAMDEYSERKTIVAWRG